MTRLIQLVLGLLLLTTTCLGVAADKGDSKKSSDNNQTPVYPMMGHHMMGNHMMGGMGMGQMRGRMGMMYGGMGGMGMMHGGMGMMHGGMGMMSLRYYSKADRPKIRKLLTETRKQHWTIMGKIMEKQAQLAELYDADKLDTKAISKTYGEIFKLRQQMIDARLKTVQKLNQFKPTQMGMMQQ